MILVCRLIHPTLKPYLSYTITVKSTKLNVWKLSEYQVSLYQKICELWFDENLTFQQIASRLNKEGWKTTRGKKHSSGTCCSNYYKIRKHFERKYKYSPPDLDDVKLIFK